MAWTDQCKIQAVQTINKVAEDMKVSVTKAIEAVSKEADIPASTLQSWYYPRSKKSWVETYPTNTDSQEAKASEQPKSIPDNNPKQSQPITEWSDTDEEIKPTNQPKPKEIEKRPRREPEDNRITTAFFRVYDEMKWVIVAERKAGWPGMAKDTATQYVQSLQNLIDMGE